MRRVALVILLLSLLSDLPGLPGLPGLPDLRGRAVLAAQVPFEQAARDLTSRDPSVRLRTVQMLTEAAYPEAAVPLAPLVTDPDDAVQLAAIAAELNIFVAERIVPRKRVGLVVEVRNQILAEPVFSAGRSSIGARPVPIEVLAALRAAVRDDNPRVRMEALYAFGALADEPSGERRRELLRASGPEIAAQIGAPDPPMRFAAVRVMGRVFARRAGDAAIDPTVGDAVIGGLNDGDRAVKTGAMRALGAMRYERAVDALTTLFEYYAKGDNAEAALDALAHIAHPVSVPLFVEQLASRTAALRALAIDGLAREGDPAMLDRITAIADADRDDAVTLAGAFAAALLGNGSLDRLVQAAAKPNAQARRYLVELAPGRSQLFARQAMDPDERIRLEVVDALGVSGDAAALKIVEPLAQDRDPRVARAADLAAARLRAAAHKPGA